MRSALANHIAAATLIPAPGKQDFSSKAQLRFAFDGDSVLFSDEAERVYKTQGLMAFSRSEQSAAKTPLMGGPFKSFLEQLHRIQSAFQPEECPIRTALVTARCAPAHERVIRTLREWKRERLHQR